MALDGMTSKIPTDGNGDYESNRIHRPSFYQMQLMLVNLIANANYDVTRYPGHVAWITESNVSRRGFLEKLIDQKQWGRLHWISRYVLGLAILSAVPTFTLLVKQPSRCKYLDNLRILDIPEISDATHKVLTDMWECSNINSQTSMRGILEISLIPASLAPCLYLFMTVTLWLSLFCTDRLYRLYVKFVVSVLNTFQAKIEPVLFNGLKKPTEHSVSSIISVGRRIWYLPYYIGIMFAILLVFFAGVALFYHEISWGFVMVVFVYQTYCPVMKWTYGAEDTLVKVLLSELRKRDVEERDVVYLGSEASTSYMQRIQGRSSCFRPQTDVWLRLFYNKGKTFALSCLELSMILRYFEDNQRGLDWRKEKFVAWPIWWHDDLHLTGNGMIQDVWIEDLNILLSTNTTLMDTILGYQLLNESPGGDVEAEKFVEMMYNRAHKLYDEKGKATSD